MLFAVRPLTQADAEEIAIWTYPGEFAFYDSARDPDDLAVLLDPELRADDCHAADGEDGRLAGFFQIKPGACVEIGLGLRPDLCGRGLGERFTRAGIELIRRLHGGVRIVLAVGAFNARAITVYQRCGFAETGRHCAPHGGRRLGVRRHGASVVSALSLQGEGG
jgi:[ribosomal protein S18]-alanine N-acetyltransferase